MEDNESLPWYRDTQIEPPFRLTTRIQNRRDVNYHFVALFPWTLISLHSLAGFHDEYSDAENNWPKFIDSYAGSIVVGSTKELYLVRLRPSGKQKKQIRIDTGGRPITAVAWALSRLTPFDPLIVIGLSSMVCVYSVKLGMGVGFHRGHGGPISSIAVHPRIPSYICTTSSDQTARIYDLDTHHPDGPQEIQNPFWVPGTGQSRGGAAHGMRSSEQEEWGKGCCTTVLVGGRSGGHLAAVTCAAFHPTFPLIATGGMDRVVKIWRLHDHQGQLRREDKPLYSSTLVHRSAAASVVWLSEDTLLTHCTSTAFASHIVLPNEKLESSREDEEEHSRQEWTGASREDEEDNSQQEGTGPSKKDEEDHGQQEWTGCPGRIVIFRWLGLNRFFPPEQTKYPSIQRGCVSDYQDSSSFTVISSVPLPYYPQTPHLRVFGDMYHDHIVLVTHQGTAIHLLNTSLMPAIETPEFPNDRKRFPSDVMVQSRLRAEEKMNKKCLQDNNWVPELGWYINLDPTFAADNEHINAVDMGLNGEMIVAVGTRGSLWIWMKDV